MVVHLEHAPLAGAAVVCAVWFRELAFLAEPGGAARGDGDVLY